MKNNDRPDILNRFRNIKLKKELTALLALFVMISTSYVMIHPGEALNNNVARSFMFFEENAEELFEQEREGDAALEATADTENVSDREGQDNNAATEGPAAAESETAEISYAPTQTPAEIVVPTLEPATVPEMTASANPAENEPTASPETLESADPAETEDPQHTASAEPSALASASTEPSVSPTPGVSASAEPTGIPEATEEPEEEKEPWHFVNWRKEDGEENKPEVIVTVEAPYEAFPEGTTMEVTIIKELDEATEKQIKDTVSEENKDKFVNVTKIQAVDIVFRNADLEEIEPADGYSIKVSMRSTMIKEAAKETKKDNTDTQLIHIKEDKETNTTEAVKVDHIDATAEETEDDEIQFETDSFSTYVYIEAELTDEITLTTPDGEDVTYVVSVTYGPDAQIPENAALTVTEIAKDSEAFREAFDKVAEYKTKNVLDFSTDQMRLEAFDISIFDENGEVVEPKDTVNVKIVRKSLPDEMSTDTENLEIHHIIDNAEKDVELVATKDSSENTVEIDGEEIVADFDVDSFSTYTITWENNITKKVHYGYLEGGVFREFTNGEEGTIDLRAPTRLGDQLNLEKSIEGYRYVTTRINDAITGRQISPLLLTDPPYKDNVRNDYTNSNLEPYPSYNANLAERWNYRYRWRYRQLSSLSWNPCRDAEWNATNKWDSIVTSVGVTKPVTFSDSETDIYVVYEKGSNSVTPPGEQSDIGSLNAPSTDKNVDYNNDGTYDVTLSVTGESRSISEKTKANIVVVLDTSWSMYFDLTGVENSYSGNTSRMQVAKTAIGSLADKLFAMNAEESDTIELAFVTFAQRVRNEEEMNTIYSGTDASAFKTMVNGLNCASGTNWDDALYAANNIYFGDNDPTYIVFITDGDPISCAHPYGTYSDWDGGTYYNGRSNYQYALAAKNQADLIIAANKTLYTIGAFGSVTNLQAIGGTYIGQASSSDSINKYFDDIISEIRRNLGYSDITINDGITAMTSTSLQNGDPTEFKYYRSGGTEEDGITEKYDHTVNDGRGETWTDAPPAMYLEIIRDEGTTNYRFRKNGSDFTFTPEEQAAFIAKYVSESEQQSTEALHIKTVVWDIDLGENELLEDGVTYTVAFTVWPSQKAYDLIADLNNGVKKFNDLPQSDKDQIIVDNGVYYLKTNTNATVDYKSVKMVDGIPEGEPSTGSAPIEDPHGKMILDTETLTVRKAFSHSINAQDPFKKLNFYLVRDGQYYLENGLTTNIKPGETGSEAFEYYTIELPKNQLPENPTQAQIDAYWEEANWSDSIYIAPGLMKDSEILEKGHNYTLYETIIDGKDYEYEFTPQTVRPMNISSTSSTYLTLKDVHNIPSDRATTYKIDDTAETYITPGSGNDNVYYAEPNNKAELVGTNRKTAELDITKYIRDETGEMTTAELNAETFTYKVTLTVPVTANTRGISAYEYVARYNDELASNRFHIFGYRTSDEQTGTAGIDSDFVRFKDKVYGRYTVTSPAHPAGDYTMNCMFEDDDNGQTKTAVIYVTLKQQEVIRFTNLPSGTEYTIEEVYANLLQADPSKNEDATKEANAGRENNLSEQGYTEVTSISKNGEHLVSGDSVIKGKIEETDLDKRLYNQFTNVRKSITDDVRAELRVKKVVDGYTWGTEYYNMRLAAGEATYTDSEGGTGLSPMPPGSSVNIYNSTAEHTLSFGEVLYTRAGTYTYILSEYDNSARMPEVVFANDVTVTVVVKANETGKLYIDSVSDSTGITNNTVLTPASQESLDTVTTTMTNTTRKIHLEKVDSLNNSKKLEGAEFSLLRGKELQYISSDNRILTAEQYAELSDEAKAACKTTLVLGEANLKGFAYNTVYELKETRSPAGYIIESTSTYFMINNTDSTVKILLTDASGVPLVDEDSTPVKETDTAIISENSLAIQLKNTPGSELPMTGGSGTLPYTLGGLTVMLTALMYGFRMRRRERRLN